MGKKRKKQKTQDRAELLETLAVEPREKSPELPLGTEGWAMYWAPQICNSTLPEQIKVSFVRVDQTQLLRVQVKEKGTIPLTEGIPSAFTPTEADTATTKTPTKKLVF